MTKDYSSNYRLIIVFLSSSIFLVVFGTSTIGVSFALSILGSYLLFTSFYKLNKIKKAKEWPKVAVTVLDSNIVEKDVPDKFLNLTYYYPVIEYTYSIKDDEYTGRTYAIDLDSFFTEDIDSCRKELEEIEFVYYNPQDFRESYININISQKRRQHFIALEIGGILLVCLAIGILFI